MVHITPNLTHWHLNGARVILRADLNMPLADGTIMSDFRMQALKPTLDYLLTHGAQVILLTHIGRPTNNEPSLSTRHLISWFTGHGYTIQFAPTIADAKKSTAPIILLENLRFWPEESLNSSGRTEEKTFARELASLGDYYVNDAFGVMHRNDTSVTLLAQEFAPDHRSIGFLVEQEITALQKIKDATQKPFVAILGGGKVHDKIPLLEKFIDKANTILLVPAIVFTFQKARGIEVGKSYVDNASLEVCRSIIEACKKKNVELLFPVDYQIAMDTLNGPLSIVPADAIPPEAIGISIGPKTLSLFSEYIQNAHTIFFNGVFGFLERKETLHGACELMKLIAQSNATSIVAGGDTSAVAQNLGLLDSLDYVSTGGGAALAYIADQKLPGLSVLEIK